MSTMWTNEPWRKPGRYIWITRELRDEFKRGLYRMPTDNELEFVAKKCTVSVMDEGYGPEMFIELDGLPRCPIVCGLDPYPAAFYGPL